MRFYMEIISLSCEIYGENEYARLTMLRTQRDTERKDCGFVFLHNKSTIVRTRKNVSITFYLKSF